MSTEVKKLYRSRNDRMIGGICGGLGAYLGMDPTVLRLVFVLIAALSGGVPAVAAYIIMLFVIPEEPGTFVVPPPASMSTSAPIPPVPDPLEKVEPIE